MKVTDVVGKDKVCRFSHFVNSELWYEAENGFLFPVTTYDAGTARFNAEEKSVLLMRWVRQHLKKIEEAREEV
jgi:hypothetical protein